MAVTIVWLRRDLRLADHPALAAVVEEGSAVVPVFCFDRRLLHGRHASGARTQFLLESLRDLDGSLRKRGSRLVVREGLPERELPALAAAVGADAVHATADVGPFARGRDERVRRALAAVGAALVLHPGLFVVDDPAAIVTKAGRPYTVFTPFYRSWLAAARRATLPAPDGLPRLPARLRVGRLPRLEQLGLRQELAAPAMRGGEAAGRARLDTVAVDGSRLSAYLHFGCVSAREFEERLDAGRGADELRRQLCWRDFYAQVLAAFPSNARHEHQPQYRGTLRWSRSRVRFEAWCEGRTGYPLVDASMRQLREEGWMPNRCRLVVGSFLTKDLGIDWRRGERWFMRLLLDGDEANNNGNWQWIASVGVDPQAPARRIYNPSLQQARLDPDGSFVRRYVPELARVPGDYLAEPWTMPGDVQHEAGCIIGRDYPRPIVGHAVARREAIERYAAARMR